MWQLIKNETYKFFKNKKNIIIIIFFLAYLIGANLYNFNKKDMYMKEQQQAYLDRTAQASGELGTSVLLLEKDENLTLKEKETLEKEIEFYTVEKSKLSVMALIYDDNDPDQYKNILIAENDRYKNIIKGIENKTIKEDFLNSKNLTIEDMNKKVYINTYILENEIQPIINPYIMTGANSLIKFFEGNNLIILIFLMVLLSVDIYLSELEEESYKLAYTQPVKRNQIYLSKIVTIVIISLLIIILGIALNFIVVSIIFGIGNIDYPFITMESIKSISFSGNNVEYEILPLWKFFILGIILLLQIVICIISLTISTSIFTDSTRKTLGFSIMILVLAFIFNNFLSSESIVHLVYPYSYLFVRDVIEFNNTSIYLFGILLNSLISIGLVAISYLKFINKDFLGVKV